MTRETDKDKVAYQKSPLRHARGMYDQARHRGWQPEHERLNVDPHPVQDFSQEFRFAKRPSTHPAGPVAGGHSAASRHTNGAPARQVRMPRQPVNVTGMSHENAWMDGSAPYEYDYDAVPDPPPTPFTHVAVSNDPRISREKVDEAPLPPARLQPEHPPKEDPSLRQVLEGEYCVFVAGQLLFSTPSLDEAEDALNRLIFSDNPVPIEDVVVMRRLNLKIGASIG